MSTEKPRFDAADLTSRLISEFGYPKTGAQRVAGKLVVCNPTVKAAFWHWWQTGTLDAALEVEGYTLAQLMNEHGMKPIAAFLTLDWLAREPEAARASLARGHDRVVNREEK